MSEITYTFKPTKIFVDSTIEGYDNVISKIEWIIEFTDGTSSNYAGGASYLDTSDLNGFMAIDQVTDKMLEQWVIEKEGGERFVAMLMGINTDVLKRKTKDKTLTEYQPDGITKTNTPIFQAPVI